MSGHTKEPWKIWQDDVCGDCIVDSSDYHVAECQGGRTFGHDEANARRIVDCVNALAGIENPAAFVQAARGMVPLLEQAFNEAILDADLADAIEAALTAFRAATGEQA